jgi:hypothetical protein
MQRLEVWPFGLRDPPLLIGDGTGRRALLC